MAVGFEVSVFAGGDIVDLADLVATLSSLPLPSDLRLDVGGNSIRVQAERRSTLTAVAGPLVAWWLARRPEAVLRLDAAGGDLRINPIAGDFALEVVLHFVEHETGPIGDRDDAVADERRARHRGPRSSPGFTARVVGISREDGILNVGVAESPDGTGRSLVLQGVDPTSENADLLDADDPAYCLVTETASTVYGGLTAVALQASTLRIQLTRAAAKELGVAPSVTIPLDVDSSAIADLRTGIRDVLSRHAGRQPMPTLSLD